MRASLLILARPPHPGRRGSDAQLLCWQIAQALHSQGAQPSTVAPTALGGWRPTMLPLSVVMLPLLHSGLRQGWVAQA